MVGGAVVFKGGRSPCSLTGVISSITEGERKKGRGGRLGKEADGWVES